MNLALVFGLLGGLAVGSSDFIGRTVTKRANSVTAVINAGLGSIVTSIVLLMAVPSVWDHVELVRGAASGSVMGLGLAGLYHALSLTSASLVGPIVAVLGAIVPVAYDLVDTGFPPALAMSGIALAIAGLASNTISPDFGGDVRTGLRFAFLAGLLMGISLLLAGTSTEASGMWPLVSQRVLLTITLIALGAAQRKPLLAPGRLRYLSATGGVLGGAGLGLFVAGSQRGSLAQVTIAFSLYPAVTAIWATAIDGERVRWWQALGFGGVLAGVAMIAVSQIG